MGGILQAVNDLFAGVMPISDFLWDVPTNFNWYSSIPILGQYSLGIIFLLGIGIYFTIRLKGVQFKEFKESIRMLTHSKKEAKVGTTPLQAFLMSMGGRVGAGNIVGCGAGRHRQHRRRLRRDPHRRSRRDLLDVGVCCSRYVYCFC